MVNEIRVFGYGFSPQNSGASERPAGDDATIATSDQAIAALKY